MDFLAFLRAFTKAPMIFETACYSFLVKVKSKGHRLVVPGVRQFMCLDLEFRSDGSRCGAFMGNDVVTRRLASVCYQPSVYLFTANGLGQNVAPSKLYRVQAQFR